MSSLNPRNQWRFTYETLAHIPTLRLYLLNPSINPSTRCLSINSKLELSHSLLVISWFDLVESREVSIRVPIPRVLIDPDSKVEVLGRDDHIEVKMKMVLPVDHPVVLNFSGELDRVRPIELGSDLENLSSQGVHLFCKFCLTRLTKDPLRRFMEMPSVNWREVADNWFGACCCSFGGISEKLVLQYIKTYSCVEGTCLLDDASVIICKDDLEGYSFQNTTVEDTVRLNNSFENLEKPNSQSADESSSTEHCHCHLNQTGNEVKVEPEKIQKWLHDCSLGSGFMSRTSNLSNDVEWVEFCCRNCSSVLGAYPTYKTRNVPVDGGIRLYKCYISTSIIVGGSCDIFRRYTLERVIVNLLLEGAKDELSYRIILRDLRTKSPMLQIILLNSDSWCSSGYCFEDATMKPKPEADLQPIVKVLFSDCGTATEASSRMIRDWSSKTHTEEVYMMPHEIQELKKCLKSAANMLPNSCSYFQGMSLSSMER